MERLTVDTAEIEYEVHGSGEPVLLVAPAVAADGLGRPLIGQAELASRYRLIHYHRRGYMGSTVGEGPVTIARQAADAAALLRHLEEGPAYIVGHSFGAVVALQLALDAPVLVHSLALLEPALGMVPSGQEHFKHSFIPALQAYRSGDARRGIELFLNGVFGPGWEVAVDRAAPGGVEQAIADAGAFFEIDAPSLRDWSFGDEEAARIRRPVLSVLGARSAPLFQDGRDLLRSWFPQLEELDVEGGTHLLQIRDPAPVAQGLARFFARHPIPSRPPSVVSR